MQKVSLVHLVDVFCTIANRRIRARRLLSQPSRVMIEEMDKLPATDLFGRSEENVFGIYSSNQTKYLSENLFCTGECGAVWRGQYDEFGTRQSKVWACVGYAMLPVASLQFKLNQVNCDHSVPVLFSSGCRLLCGDGSDENGDENLGCWRYFQRFLSLFLIAPASPRSDICHRAQMC